jgi:hypothetical protein
MSNNFSSNPETNGEIVIREATAADRGRLSRLAELDSSRAPADPVLIAEVDGELLAAVSMRDWRLVADPWRVTADLVEVLGIHAGLEPSLAGSRLRSVGRLRWGLRMRRRTPRPSSPTVPGLPAIPSS